MHEGESSAESDTEKKVSNDNATFREVATIEKQPFPKTYCECNGDFATVKANLGAGFRWP